MPKGNTTPRTDKQKQKTKEVKATFSAVGTSQAEKQALKELLNPFKKNNLNLANIDTTKLQNITKGV